MPAYDGLSLEQRGLQDGTLILHTCGNGIPKFDTICPFCHRVNITSEEQVAELIKIRERELFDELEKLKKMQEKKKEEELFDELEKLKKMQEKKKEQELFDELEKLKKMQEKT